MTANRVALTPPPQLIKTVYGITSRMKGGSQLAFCANDPTLSSMDAPEIMPSGSTRRIEDFSGNSDSYYQRGSICYRDLIVPPFCNF